MSSHRLGASCYSVCANGFQSSRSHPVNANPLWESEIHIDFMIPSLDLVNIPRRESYDTKTVLISRYPSVSEAGVAFEYLYEYGYDEDKKEEFGEVIIRDDDNHRYCGSEVIEYTDEYWSVGVFGSYVVLQKEDVVFFIFKRSDDRKKTGVVTNEEIIELSITFNQFPKMDPKKRLIWEITNWGAEARDLKNEDLSGSELTDANLSIADLSNSDLSYSNLQGANLSMANLSDADLSYADLKGANLSKADLFSVDLSNTNLIEANFINYNLQATNLQGADLRGVRLEGANFAEADLRGAILTGEELISTNYEMATYKMSI